MKKALLSLMLSTLLVACGGSSNDNGSSTDTTSKIGVLTDGPVAGASYIINGVTKKTNAAGEFEYQEGDQVEFLIGNISLGTVLAGERVTPVELSKDKDESYLVNLLVFLQSLDNNEKHEDGIQIPDNISFIGSNNNINFNQSTEQFVTSFQPILNSLPDFENKEVVSPDLAKENFSKALLKDIVGIWFAKNDESEVVLQINSDGSYMIGEPILIEPTSSSNGMEYGFLEIDATTGTFNAYTEIDTNEDWGLNDNGETRDMTISFDGTTLKIAEKDNPNESATFTKIVRNNSDIVGAWRLSRGLQLFVFNSNGTYIMVDPIGDDQVEEGDEPCGGPGIEYGKYRVSNNKLFIDETSIDTNGCAGLNDSDSSGIDINITPTTLTLTIADEGSYAFTRLN